MEYSSPFKKYSAPVLAADNAVKLTPETAILVDCIPVMTDSDDHVKIAHWLDRVTFAAKMSGWNIATLAVVATARIAPKYQVLINSTPLSKIGPNGVDQVAVTIEEFLTSLSEKLLATKKASTEELLQFKMEREESIHDYCRRAADLIARSNLAKLPESSQVEFVTNALNQQWQDFIWYRQDKIDTFDKLYKELSDAEKRRPKKSEKSKKFHENSGKKIATPGKPKVDSRTCFLCRQTGHVAAGCPKRSESESTPNVNLNFGFATPSTPAQTPKTPVPSYTPRVGFTPRKGATDSKIQDSSSPYKPKVSKFNISAVEEEPSYNNQSRSRDSVADLSEN